MTRDGDRGKARGRSRGRLGYVALAGWLFADLLLVLAVVALSDRPDPLAAQPARHPRPTATPTPKPSPSPTGPRSLDRSRKTFRVSGTDKGAIASQIRKATARWDGQEAALVQTFGGGQGGTRYAHRVNSLLHKARPGMFPGKTATDDFLKLGGRASTAEVWIYFYTS